MNEESLIHAICLLGPTATGKTDICLELAQHLPIEVISVDSALVYRDMNIGTAKPELDALSQPASWSRGYAARRPHSGPYLSPLY